MATGYDDIIAALRGAVAPGPSSPAPSTVPPVSADGGTANQQPKSYLADLPDWNSIRSKRDAEMAIAGAERAIGIWNKRLLDEVYRATNGGSSGLTEDDFKVIEGEYYINNSKYNENGELITQQEWKDRKAEVSLAEESDSEKDRPKSDWEREILFAIDELKNYRDTVDSQMDVLEDEPEDPKKTGPGTQGKPIEVGLNHLLAAIANQESSSGYRPSWASATLTGGFGPTDEVRDGSYTDPVTGEYYPHFNKGYDFGLPVGTDIETPVSGTVISVGRPNPPDGWGVSIKIRDADGNIHNFGHLSHVGVPQGTTVQAGQVIGKSGDSSDPIPGTDMTTSSGPHLSYDVWDQSGRYLDPKQFIEGGGYDKVNEDSGAYGRYQFMPGSWAEWTAEFGMPGAPPTPENQEYIAQQKMAQYYEMAGGDIHKVTMMWYGGPGVLNYTEEQLRKPQGENGEYPSLYDYALSVTQKAVNLAKTGVVPTQAPDGTWITGPGIGGSSGSKSSTYDPLKARQDKEDRDYELWKRALGLDVSRATEMDRRYDDISSRMKDYGTVAKNSNDLLADIATALGNEAKLIEMNQGIQDSAMGTAAQINAAVQAGKLGYRDALAGPIWSNSLSPIQKELERVRAQMTTAPEGFADSILATIPKTIQLPYEVTGQLGLPGYEGEYWGTQRYGTGTVPRYANGTTSGISWHDEPYVALYNSGKYVPSSILARLRAAGAIDQAGTGIPGTNPGTTVPNQVVPAGSNTTYRPGYVPRNSILPPDMRVFDDGEWLDAAVSKAAMMISSGNSAFASAWGLGDLTPYHGMPASAFDGGVLQALRAGILANKDNPSVTQIFGSPPGIPTVWVPDPNNPETANPGGAANTRTSGTGFTGNPGQAQYGGTYGGSMDPYDSARIALEKEQLALQREVAKAQMQLDRDRFALEQQQFGSAQEYQAAQIRWNDAKAALDEKNYQLQLTQAELQKAIFEDNVRRFEIETGMAREQLDMAKVKQAADLDYQAGQLELARQAGALSQAEYEEKKRQFEMTFNYQKEKDQKALDIERAKTTVSYLANPKDAVRQQFWYASQADPVGTAYDLFTGENRGEKTYTEAYNEDSQGFMEAMKPYKQYADGSDSFVRDVAAILGDSPKNARATGFEEVIINPTGAPFMVLSNDMSRALGFVPKKGKPFGSHVREGRAS